MATQMGNNNKEKEKTKKKRDSTRETRVKMSRQKKEKINNWHSNYFWQIKNQNRNFS
jgi:hypothetical protein